MEIALDERPRADFEIEDGVRDDSGAVKIPGPFPIRAADEIARHQRVNVAIREHDEAGPERGDEIMNELIEKVRRVEERQRRVRENVSLFRVFQLLAHEVRAAQPHVADGKPIRFEPLCELRNLRRAP